MKNPINTNADFDYLISFLPVDWQAKAKELGALRRCRKIPDAETLLRILLLHLADGCSLRETAVRIQRGGIANVSDVAIMDRLRVSGDWLRWMSVELMKSWVGRQPEFVFGKQRRVRLVDGTRVKEPGPTGSLWCIHYSVELATLRCCELHVQDQGGNGETFRKFCIHSGDLMLGDRAYGTPPGIFHVVDHGGDVLVRFGWSLLPFWALNNDPFDLFGSLKTLQGTKLGDWDAVIKNGERQHTGRICAVKKSRQAAEVAQKKAIRAAQRHGVKIQPETLEAASYFMIFTTLDRKELSAGAALNAYRGRWQIELVFKRLKSLLGFGHLRKKDKTSAEAWLHGKLLVAFLVEAMLREGEAFSPWGYVIREA